jgi:hypothetical protein
METHYYAEPAAKPQLNRGTPAAVPETLLVNQVDYSIKDGTFISGEEPLDSDPQLR